MAKNIGNLKNELKGLGKDLSKALKTMVKSQKLKNLEKDVLAGIKSIAKSVSESVRAAQKSKSAGQLKKRLGRVVKAGKKEGLEEANRAQAAASRGIRKIRQKLKRLPKEQESRKDL